MKFIENTFALRGNEPDNAFSKKLSHLKAAVALHFAHYNLCRIHGSLRVTPAMEAGITDRQWNLTDLLCQGGARPDA